MNKENIKFWNVKTEGDKSTIDLFGYVGGSKYWDDGFNEEDFLRELREIPADNELLISINSTGGSVFTALSIYALLKAHKGAITFRVNGVAMSAATIITSVPNAKVIMPRGALMMIHKASTGAVGNIDDLRKMADDLEKIENNILSIYAEKTGKPLEEIKNAVDAETYFTADEAVAFGLADEVDESQTIKNEFTNGVFMLGGQAINAEAISYKATLAKLFDAEATNEADAVENKGEIKMDIETIKAEYADIYEAIRKEAMADGAAQERARIQAIEDIATAGHEELVNKAKFTEPMTAEALAVEILKADKARAVKALNDRVEDAATLNAITADGNEGLIPNAEKINKKNAEQKAIIEAGAKAFSRK